ncbi:hypothetical protein DPEC_G00336990 [Dallia pectoralis]|uniref:Uncharacterized protein n=1 Tax=Dallia pectoralis TaxID=75939 RepID=A0ACC2F7P3_DALPE|nr:hypothetical protein DPEC_G00336990 [Dallia pectoralis]
MKVDRKPMLSRSRLRQSAPVHHAAARGAVEKVKGKGGEITSERYENPPPTFTDPPTHTHFNLAELQTHNHNKREVQSGSASESQHGDCVFQSSDASGETALENSVLSIHRSRWNQVGDKVHCVRFYIQRSDKGSTLFTL